MSSTHDAGTPAAGRFSNGDAPLVRPDGVLPPEWGVDGASSVPKDAGLSLLAEIIVRHLFPTCRIGIQLSHFLVDRFGLMSGIKL
jgi:hypothetical protein